ncbi:unnamed protein product [Ectocarpus sp. 12 AP-2014]
MPLVVPTAFCRRNSSPWSIRDAKVSSLWCARLLLPLLLLMLLPMLTLLVLVLVLLLLMLTLLLLLILILLVMLLLLLTMWRLLLLVLLLLLLLGLPIARSSHARGEADSRRSVLRGGIIVTVTVYHRFQSQRPGLRRKGTVRSQGTAESASQCWRIPGMAEKKK